MDFPVGFSLIILCLLPPSTLSTSDNHHHQDGNSPILKSLHFTLYKHETYNKTAYVTIKGVAGPKRFTKTSNPFGSLVAFNDPLTETEDPFSKVLGYMEGSAVTSSFDGGRTTCICRTSLNFKGYKGDLLNVGTAYYTQVSELPLVGGTGDFRFVQGYMTFSVVDLSGPAACYKTDFHLYWPPYATSLIP
ncbi:hypothetical protein SOVF_146010 [Spinacia oleracea]|nr:hypothetical protein SOVF_146010 [Spinacia oleracea]